MNGENNGSNKNILTELCLNDKYKKVIIIAGIIGIALIFFSGFIKSEKKIKKLIKKPSQRQ